jgi:EpsI family protein
MNWHLSVTLALLAVAGAAIHLTPSVTDTESSRLIVGIPETVAGWTSTEGAPEALLPLDPSEKSALRRTYRKDGREAFVSIALFTRQDDPRRRASINLIYPLRGTSLIERSHMDLVLGQPGEKAASLPAAVVHEGDRRLAILYWHQIGKQTYSNEYRLRLVLLGRILFARRADMLLVRIAVPATGTEGAPAALRTASEVAPFLYMAIAELDR